MFFSDGSNACLFAQTAACPSLFTGCHHERDQEESQAAEGKLQVRSDNEGEDSEDSVGERADNRITIG